MTASEHSPSHDLALDNVVAVFDDPTEARAAIDELHEAGINGPKLSLLLRPREEEHAGDPLTQEERPGSGAVVATADPMVSQTAMAHEVDEAPVELAKGVATGGVTGAAIGGVGGLVAGAVALAIPGIGPAVAAGIWLAPAMGAAAGATVGGVLGGAMKATEQLYHEAVIGGGVVVGVHSNEEKDGDRAVEILRRHQPQRLDRFDADGTHRAVPNIV